MKKIFITGICGFVGSSLASFFHQKNYKVYGIDNSKVKNYFNWKIKYGKRWIFYNILKEND